MRSLSAASKVFAAFLPAISNFFTSSSAFLSATDSAALLSFSAILSATLFAYSSAAKFIFSCAAAAR
jgi:hypothetical protein